METPAEMNLKTFTTYIISTVAIAGIAIAVSELIAFNAFFLIPALIIVGFAAVKLYHRGHSWYLELEKEREELKPIRENAAEIAEIPQKVEEIYKIVKEELPAQIRTIVREEITKALPVQIETTVKDEIQELFNPLTTKTYIQNRSPLDLNEAEAELSNKIGAETITSKYKDY